MEDELMYGVLPTDTEKQMPYDPNYPISPTMYRLPTNPYGSKTYLSSRTSDYGYSPTKYLNSENVYGSRDFRDSVTTREHDGYPPRDFRDSGIATMLKNDYQRKMESQYGDYTDRMSEGSDKHHPHDKYLFPYTGKFGFSFHLCEKDFWLKFLLLFVISLVSHSTHLKHSMLRTYPERRCVETAGTDGRRRYWFFKKMYEIYSLQIVMSFDVMPLTAESQPTIYVQLRAHEARHWLVDRSYSKHNRVSYKTWRALGAILVYLLWGNFIYPFFIQLPVQYGAILGCAALWLAGARYTVRFAINKYPPIILNRPDLSARKQI